MSFTAPVLAGGSASANFCEFWKFVRPPTAVMLLLKNQRRLRSVSVLWAANWPPTA